MAKKLKNLKITSVDLCPQGANQEAYIKFYKSDEGGEKVEKKRGLLDLIKKAFGLEDDEEATQVKNELLQEIKEEDVKDTKVSEKETKENLDDDPKKEELEKGDGKVSTINLNELPEEKRKAIEAIMNGKEKEVIKEKEIVKEDNSEVKKEYKDIKKELVDVKKELRIAKAVKEFTKYETLGKDPETVAKQYIELENISEDIAKDFVSTLDDALKVQEESGIFKSAGKDGHSEVVEKNMTTLKAKAAEIQARDKCGKEEAIVKAYDENPELYEALIENK